MPGYWDMKRLEPDTSQMMSNVASIFLQAQANKRQQQQMAMEQKAMDDKSDYQTALREQAAGRPDIMQRYFPQEYQAQQVAAQDQQLAQQDRERQLKNEQIKNDSTVQNMNQLPPLVYEVAAQYHLGPGQEKNILAHPRIGQEVRSILQARARGSANANGAPIGAVGNSQGAATPPGVQSIAKAIIDGRYEMPKGTALRSPVGQQIMSAVADLDPAFDASQWNLRNSTRKEFTSGSAAKNVTSLNTMIQHLGEMADASKALDNSKYPLWNMVTNKAAESSGDPRITRFKTISHAVADEAGKLFRGTGGTTDNETIAMQAVLGENAAPAQQMEAAKTLIHLASGRLDAMKDQWNNAFRGTQDFEFLTPKSQSILKDKLGVEIQDAGQPRPQAASAASSQGQPRTVKVKDASGRTGTAVLNPGDTLPAGVTEIQ